MHGELQQAIQSCLGNAAKNGEARSAAQPVLNSFVTNMNALHPAILSELSPVLDKELVISLTTLNKSAADLKSKAGGSAKSSHHWSAGMPADHDIMKWFEEALDKTDANEIEKRLQKVKQARFLVGSWRVVPPFESNLERLHFTCGTLDWIVAVCDRIV